MLSRKFFVGKTQAGAVVFILELIFLLLLPHGLKSIGRTEAPVGRSFFKQEIDVPSVDVESFALHVWTILARRHPVLHRNRARPTSEC